MYAVSIPNLAEVKKVKGVGLHDDTTAVQWYFIVFYPLNCYFGF